MRDCIANSRTLCGYATNNHAERDYHNRAGSSVVEHYADPSAACMSKSARRSESAARGRASHAFAVKRRGRQSDSGPAHFQVSVRYWEIALNEYYDFCRRFGFKQISDEINLWYVWIIPKLHLKVTVIKSSIYRYPLPL